MLQVFALESTLFYMFTFYFLGGGSYIKMYLKNKDIIDLIVIAVFLTSLSNSLIFFIKLFIEVIS